MEWYWVAALLFGLGVGLMMLGMPVAIGVLRHQRRRRDALHGRRRRHPQIINNGFGAMTNFALVPIPMFLLMGELFYHTGLADAHVQRHRQAAGQHAAAGSPM